LEKDGGNIKNATNLKNKIKIVMLGDTIYRLCMEFLTRHIQESLIHYYVCQPYPSTKNFSLKNLELKREFFKHMGHFTNKKLNEYVLHLLWGRAKHTQKYPKVSIRKTKFTCEDNAFHAN